MAGRRERFAGGSVTPNLTPMVDVVFLLIIFFVLVAQITSAERIELALAQVERMQGLDPGDERRVVVNVIPPGSPERDRVWCRMGSAAFTEAGAGALVDALAQIRRNDPDVRVTIRAARDESYERVHPVLEACREAGIARANLAAVEHDDG